MNHYDDLQRFKDKTRTQNLEFRDLSAQSSAHERGDWAILDQLSPSAEKESTLAIGGLVSQIVPQPVAANTFVSQSAGPAPSVPSRAPETVSETRATSIMQSVAGQIREQESVDVAPVAETPPVVAVPTPAPVVPTAESAPPVAQTPLPPPASRTAQPAIPAESVNYSRLFAPKTAEQPGRTEKEEKDQPLKSLLERIASCR